MISRTASGDSHVQSGAASRRPFERSGLLRWWQHFDVNFMKPLLTNSRPTLIDTMPECCLPVARLLTTTEQLNEDGRSMSRFCARSEGEDYDSDDDGLIYQQQQIDSPFSQSTTYNGTGHSTRRSAQQRLSQDPVEAPIAGANRTRAHSSLTLVDSGEPVISFDERNRNDSSERF